MRSTPGQSDIPRSTLLLVKRIWNNVKRVWNKLFGSGSFDPSMTEQEKNVARNDMARQQAEQERLNNEIRVRQGYNGGFGGLGG